MALRHQAERQLIFDAGSLGRYSAERALELRRFFDLPDWFTTNREAGFHGRIASAAMRMRVGRFLPYSGVNDASFAKHLRHATRTTAPRRLVLDGYFQRDWPWSTFDNVRQELIAMLKAAPARPNATYEFDCSMHIRGGDFLASERYRVVDTEFYTRALAALKQQMKVNSVYVVTDDSAHAKRIVSTIESRLPGTRLHVPDERGDMTQDFTTLRQAKARIIGNSTFSWWAAALDPHRAITIGPNQWIRGQDRNLILPWETILPV